jgi:arabinan endo-1,5-alpha-L-arabinosidase
MLKLKDIQIRDPFILPVEQEKTYYMYGTTDKDCWGKGISFEAYKSRDLKSWGGPFTVFTPPSDFWADRNFWAPEVHKYKEAYYMFATFKSPDHCRGTQILRADSPLGPFIPHTDEAVTPRDRECLDGTLYVDKENNPWIVFCHEWKQITDGTICAQRLSSGLERAEGEIIKLITASEAPWIEPFRKINYVTDGPFLYRAEDGTLIMLWSSFKNDLYAIGLAYSDNGEITGTWKHKPEILFPEEGGHCMLFKDFESNLYISYHSPNKTPLEKPEFRRIPCVIGLL